MNDAKWAEIFARRAEQDSILDAQSETQRKRYLSGEIPTEAEYLKSFSDSQAAYTAACEKIHASFGVTTDEVFRKYVCE
jgi:hypothetical protein